MSTITEIRKINQDVVIGHKCDACGVSADGMPDTWLGFNHHHHGWGNNSCDSYEYFHVCSPECFLVQLKKSVDELKNERTGEVADMPVLFAESLIKFMER